MKKGFLNSLFNIIKEKCTDTDFICKTADTIVSGISVAKNINSNNTKTTTNHNTYQRSPDIKRYYDLHKEVMREIDSNRGTDHYKRNPVTKEEVINVLLEAEKILTESDYKLYQKYYVYFHGGNGKTVYDNDDKFRANPSRR